MNMREIREAARGPMKNFCKLCPVCDGRACAGQVPGMGGTITGEHGTGKLKKKLAYIMYGPEKMAKLCQFKHAMDPKGLLGPGNILTEVEA